MSSNSYQFTKMYMKFSHSQILENKESFREYDS